MHKLTKKLLPSIFLLLSACGPNSDFKRAATLEEAGQYKEAVSIYQGIQYRYSENWGDAEARIARIHLKQGDYETAISKYLGISTATASQTLISEINTGLANAYLKRGDFFQTKGDFRKAIADYSLASKMPVEAELQSKAKDAIKSCEAEVLKQRLKHQEESRQQQQAEAQAACSEAYQTASDQWSACLRGMSFVCRTREVISMCSSILRCVSVCGDESKCDVIYPRGAAGFSIENCRELVAKYKQNQGTIPSTRGYP